MPNMLDLELLEKDLTIAAQDGGTPCKRLVLSGAVWCCLVLSGAVWSVYLFLTPSVRHL